MTHRFTIPPRLVDPFASPVLAGAQDATVLEVTGAPRVQTLIAELFGQQSRGDRRPVTGDRQPPLTPGQSNRR